MLESFLFNVPDHRRKQGQRYRLGHVLMLSILAILSHADSYRKIHSFIVSHYETLNKQFQLNWKKLPAYTTIRNIIIGVSAAALEESFRNYSMALLDQNKHGRFVAFDGKVLRGSFDHFQDHTAIQILSAFVTDDQIILAHQEIEEKTNEIPTAQELMVELGLEHCVFTFDAINCQHKTLATAVETKNDVIVQVKENQKTLLRDCIQLSQTTAPTATYQEPVNKDRNRVENRRVEIYENPQFRAEEKWSLINTLVKLDRSRAVFNTKNKEWQNTHETSYYISTISLSAEMFGNAIRKHWGIENRNHYVRDVSLNEDKSRIRVNAHIFAKLRSFALNIMRANKVNNISKELYENSLNIQKILNYWGVRQN